MDLVISDLVIFVYSYSFIAGETGARASPASIPAFLIIGKYKLRPH